MGRNKEFNEKVVLEKAMSAFWEKGYEHTTMENLVEHMGIHRRSIYDTFGDKHDLFMRSLDLYQAIIENKIKTAVSQQTGIKEQLRAIFTLAFTNNHCGCLIVNTATELSTIDTVVGEKIEYFFEHEENQLFHLLLLAQENKEISEDVDVTALTYALHNALVGIRVLSKTTTNIEKLNIITEQTLATIGYTEQSTS